MYACMCVGMHVCSCGYVQVCMCLGVYVYLCECRVLQQLTGILGEEPVSGHSIYSVRSSLL